MRGRHRNAKATALWIGDRGPMTTSGIRQMLTRRGRDAGVKVHPHMFRHTFGHQWKASGDETSLMRLAGWRSPQMFRDSVPPLPTSGPVMRTDGSVLATSFDVLCTFRVGP